MTPKTIYKSIYLLVLPILFVACNSGDQKPGEGEHADSSATANTTQSPAGDPAMDAVKVAPTLYKVLGDTLGIRILEATYKPGDSSGLHFHPDNAVYIETGGKTEMTSADGSKQEMEMKDGMELVMPAGVHRVKNTGTTVTKAIIVEVNRPKEIISPDAATDATKVAPDHYKVISDTMGIRLIEVNYKPGESSAFHTHPDYVFYVLNGSTAELTDKDGKKNVSNVDKGVAAINPADGHSAKLTGKTPLKMIMVEVNRPRP